MARMLVWRLAQTRWGWCAVTGRGQGVLRSCLPEATAPAALAMVGVPERAWPAEEGDQDDPDLAQAARLIKALFEGGPSVAMPRLDLTDFRPYSRDVLLACSRVPRGETITYGELAALAGHPGTARAVGQVMARNPLAPLVPCHRVIGAKGALVGFYGGLDLKSRLLEMERR